MKNGISINERIFDLRVDKDLTQAELAEALDIPVTTYCDYEREGNPVPHTLVVALAKYYGVSADYILGLSTNREPENIPLLSLCISDSAADFLRDEDTNSRLLSEIISHPAFRQFLIDAEVYVDGYVDDAIQTYNLMMDTGRRIEPRLRKPRTENTIRRRKLLKRSGLSRMTTLHRSSPAISCLFLPTSSQLTKKMPGHQTLCLTLHLSRHLPIPCRTSPAAR